MPLVEDVALFDIRDQIFTTGTGEDGKAVAANVSTKTQLLNVHDGTFFFANNVLPSMSAATQASLAEQSEAQP